MVMAQQVETAGVNDTSAHALKIGWDEPSPRARNGPNVSSIAWRLACSAGAPVVMDDGHILRNVSLSSLKSLELGAQCSQPLIACATTPTAPGFPPSSTSWSGSQFC